MTADPGKTAHLFGSSGNVLRNNLVRQIHAAGVDVDAMHRAACTFLPNRHTRCDTLAAHAK